MESETKKKELKAKTCSLIAKVVGGAVGARRRSVEMGRSVLELRNQRTLCRRIYNYGSFGTVDLNLLAEKFSRS